MSFHGGSIFSIVDNYFFQSSPTSLLLIIITMCNPLYYSNPSYYSGLESIACDQFFVPETNYLEISKVSPYEKLKSMAAGYEYLLTISKHNFVFDTVNFSKDSKLRQCVKYAQILMDQSQYCVCFHNVHIISACFSYFTLTVLFKIAHTTNQQFR